MRFNSMKILKTGTVLLMLILMAIGFSSCSSDGGSDPAGQLAGTWTITTTPDALTDNMGTATCTISYLGEMLGIDVYLGSGSISGSDGGLIDGPYTVGAAEFGGVLSFSFSDGSDADINGEDDTLDFDGALSGGTITGGDYYGWPGEAYENYSGTFNASR